MLVCVCVCVDVGTGQGGAGQGGAGQGKRGPTFNATVRRDSSFSRRPVSARDKINDQGQSALIGQPTHTHTHTPPQTTTVEVARCDGSSVKAPKL